MALATGKGRKPSSKHKVKVVRLNADFGGLYVLEFSKPIEYTHAAKYGDERHYVGIAPNIGVRFHKHRMGHGSQMTQAAIEQGAKVNLVLAAKMKIEYAESIEEEVIRQGAKAICPLCCRSWQQGMQKYTQKLWVADRSTKTLIRV